MGRIQQLDSQTANMIAAGEVVERPMGVVKELVDNAIDAGSTRIDIAIEEGGISKITIRDNGIGMDAEDAEMAFKRHATSKIRTQNDLWSIHTLGFRGEALPSISSVAKVTMITSDGHDSTRIVIEYGKTVSVSSYPCNQGTEITVEGLFYRTPARLKHMRSASYEASLIQDVIVRFALSHPEISFCLTSDGRDSFRTSGQGDLLEVLFQSGGRAVAENALKAEFEDFDYKVSGYLVKPVITRASRSNMYVFLNGRMVRTYKLHKAIQDGYEDFIVKGRYPICVLNIEMDPRLLDVNVHPSKWEVRLSKEIQLEYLIRDNVHKILAGGPLMPKVEPAAARQEYYEPLSFDTDSLIREAEVKQAQAKKESNRAELPAEEKIQEQVIEKNEPVKTEPVHRVDEATYQAILSEAKKDEEILKAAESVREPEPVYETKKTSPSFPHMDVIGQLHEKFILCAVKDGLAVIDQHAAQERVHYEEYCQKLNTNPVMLDCLVPLVVHAGSDLVARCDEINEAAADLHITFEPFGPDTLAVRSVPAWMKDLEELPFLEDVIDQFRNDRESKYTRMEKKRIATMACHHSIRFNRSLTMDEMKEVVSQLSVCENPYHCPHGRPTFVILDEKELTKEFLR
ncbi:MAG: DNA mismatch repair endonuclease MutL [Erysipelotrichaceae bacterium]|nr:DNA mismatch repair endonuclease MutL [Erysipelotrichaceae bacterium]